MLKSKEIILRYGNSWSTNPPNKYILVLQDETIITGFILGYLSSPITSHVSIFLLNLYMFMQ